MDEYIPRQAAIEATCFGCSEVNICRGTCDDTDRIRAIPPADVRPVVRAEWILLDGGRGKCPVCGFVQEAIWDYDHTQHFCGVCGADMREGDA